MSLTAEERASRLRFDYDICSRMFGDVITGSAFRSTTDLEKKVNPISSIDEGHLATKYLVTFDVPTLIAADQFQNQTTIGFDLATGNYPYSEPATWIVGPKTPWSPHFKSGAPVCIGEAWREAHGQMLLAQLFVHIAKLLNWDEIPRGAGYVGWNPQAVHYHDQKYKRRPLNPGIRYPALPAEVTHGLSADAGLFKPRAVASSAADADALFAPASRRLFS